MTLIECFEIRQFVIGVVIVDGMDRLMLDFPPSELGWGLMALLPHLHLQLHQPQMPLDLSGMLSTS